MRARIVPLTALVLALCCAGGCGHPQIGPDRETFKAVDALYTAVSLRDPGLVESCSTKLQQLQASGQLPEGAYKSLDGFIGEAKAGHWEPSQERLAQFMEAQRR